MDRLRRTFLSETVSIQMLTSGHETRTLVVDKSHHSTVVYK